MAQIGVDCLETSHYHYCEERDLPKRHLLLEIYVCVDNEMGNIYNIYNIYLISVGILFYL